MYTNVKFDLSILSPLAAAIFLTTVAHQSLALTPAEIDIGGVYMTPTLSIGAVNDSNIYDSDKNELDATIITVAPAIKFAAKQGMNIYSTKLWAKSGTYTSDSSEGDNDYVDAGLDIGAHMEASDKHMFDITADFAAKHDDRGEEFTIGAPYPFSIEEPDEYNETSFNFAYQFGRVDDSRIVFDAGIFDKEYQNHKIDTKARNYDATTFGITGFHYVAPKTAIFLELRGKNIRYDEKTLAGTTFDSDEAFAYVGFQWEYTTQVIGSAKVGVFDKNFKENSLKDIKTDTTWAIDVTYAPTEHDTLVFLTQSLIMENNGSGTAKEAREYKISYAHSWSEQFESSLSAGTKKDTFTGVGGREDDTNNYGIATVYKFRRWMDVSLSYELEDRSSSVKSLDFDKDIITLAFDFSL